METPVATLNCPSRRRSKGFADNYNYSMFNCDPVEVPAPRTMPATPERPVPCRTAGDREAWLRPHALASLPHKMASSSSAAQSISARCAMARATPCCWVRRYSIPKATIPAPMAAITNRCIPATTTTSAGSATRTFASHARSSRLWRLRHVRQRSRQRLLLRPLRWLSHQHQLLHRWRAYRRLLCRNNGLIIDQGKL